MFSKPEDARMTKEETEEYGRKINERNARYENVELAREKKLMPTEHFSPPLTDEEVKQRVGEQNYKNMKDGTTTSSINS